MQIEGRQGTPAVLCVRAVEYLRHRRREITIWNLGGIAESSFSLRSAMAPFRSRLLSLIVAFLSGIHGHHHQSHHHRSHDFPRSPAELMTDITNHLGFRILHQHSIGNRDNMALSPCGLASVLVALYEGSDGPSAVQIHKALEFPWDRDLIRIGFRDIHRRLRSYFYSHENLLSGLSLSKENVTVRPEYENILRFYGYDLENGNMITSGKSACKNETEEAPITTTIEAETMTTEDVTTEIPTTMSPPETTTTTTSMTTTTTKAQTTSTVVPTTAMASSPLETTTSAVPRTTEYIVKFKPPSSDLSEALESSTVDIETTTMSSREAGTEVPDSSSNADDDLNSLKRRRRRKNRTFNRWRRSPAPLNYFLSNLEDHSQFTISSGTPHPQYSISDYVVQNFNLKDALNETPQHEDVITHLFYLNHLDTINVPYKVFNSIMKFGYFNSIQSSVLEVDLDDPTHTLLIILPEYGYGLDTLISTMKSHYAPLLREVREALQPTWVKAIVPKFYLTGHITLTGDLQNVRSISVQKEIYCNLFICRWESWIFLSLTEPTFRP